jgi:hypothetical protein
MTLSGVVVLIKPPTRSVVVYLSAHLNFCFERGVNLIYNLEKFRIFFREISKFCAKEKQIAH